MKLTGERFIKTGAYFSFSPMLASLNRILVFLIALAVFLPPITVKAQERADSGLPDGEPWLGLRGTGLFTLPDASTLPRGRIATSITIDNRDRDPLGMDLFDFSAVVAAGISSRTEVYGQFVVSRVVALPELPTLPPHPLDIIVVPGNATPGRPHYAINPEVPYVNDRHGERFDDWIQGDATIGAKLRFRDFNPGGPAIAGRIELKLPISKSLRNLQSGSGTGGIDLSFGVVSEWRFGEHALVASAAYTAVGSPPEDDLMIEFDAEGNSVRKELPLCLPNRAQLGVGFRYVLSEHVALVGETTAAISVGGSSATLDRVDPIDLLAGVQMRFGSLRINAGLRYYANSLPSGDIRPAPYPGAVDLTGVGDPELTQYLEAIGAGDANIDPASARQRIVIGAPDDIPPPAGSRIIPDTYSIRSEHQIGSIFVIGWVF